MNKPSSTISAAVLAGGITSVLVGAASVFAHDVYLLVPPGMEAGTAVVIGGTIGYFKKENVLPVKK